MTAHRAFNLALALAIAGMLAIVGPALDEPYESPAEAARAALAAGDSEGHERLHAHCRAKHGPAAEAVWTADGPTCNAFTDQVVAARGAQ